MTGVKWMMSYASRLNAKDCHHRLDIVMKLERLV